MSDVTKLKTVEFSDKFEMGINKSQKATTNFNLRGTEKFRKGGKTSIFFDKFADPDFIDDKDTWDIISPTVKNANPIQEKDL
jgi:hypothetical protein